MDRGEFHSRNPNRPIATQASVDKYNNSNNNITCARARCACVCAFLNVNKYDAHDLVDLGAGGGRRKWPLAGASGPDGEISAPRSRTSSRPLNQKQPAVLAKSGAMGGWVEGV